MTEPGARRTRRRAGLVLIAAGVVVGAVSVGGLVRALTSDARRGGAVAASATTSAPTSSTTTTAMVLRERPEEFIAAFAAAVRAGDIDTLLARLHPAVIERYGEPRCRSYLPGVIDTDLELTVRRVVGPEPYTWETDGREAVVDDAFAVEVSRLERGETIIQEIHLAEVAAGEPGKSVAGTLRWFTDCGEPA